MPDFYVTVQETTIYKVQAIDARDAENVLFEEYRATGNDGAYAVDGEIQLVIVEDEHENEVYRNGPLA